MKLSALSAAFAALRREVDGLAQGVAAAEFDVRVDALESSLRQLQAWTRPRGGGSFEVDIEPYLHDGGAPAFMRDHAALLLAAATTLRQAQRVRATRRGAAGPAPERDGGLAARDDTQAALAAPLHYSGPRVATIQKLFKYLYSRRAYRKLATGEVMLRSVADGHLPDGVGTVAQLSKHNLSQLRRTLAPLSDPEKRLRAALRGMPFRLKHATTAASWANIFSAGLIFSKDALMDWNIVVPTHTPASDQRYKQDVDFAFFRVEIGDDDWDSRFGAQDPQQQRLVFDWSQVLDDGWVSLHDMLAPLGSAVQPSTLRTRDDDLPVRVSEVDMPAEGERKKWIHWKWKHRILATGVQRKVHILDEVFYGPDILEGLVLSVLRDLRELPALRAEALRHVQDAAYAHWLIKSLFRIEAKLPSAFRFEPEELIASYGGEAGGERAALRSATGQAPLQHSGSAWRGA